MAKSGYDQIAAEYYQSQHITSRNFDSATQAALRIKPFVLPDSKNELILEIGAGRGRANEFLGVASMRVVQLDNSRLMLELPQREPCLLQIFADACDIPLMSQQFASVVGFLIDPFLGLNCLAEVYRMLKIGGRILLTVPTREWGYDLRKRLEIDPMMTRFKKCGTEDTILLPSLLYTKEKLETMFAHTGFREVEICDHCLPVSVSHVSPDIESVAKLKDIDIYNLPVIHTIEALR